MQHAVTAQETGIVTPEAVRLDFESANIPTRFLAMLVDLLIQGAVFVAVAGLGEAISNGIGASLPVWLGATLVLLLIFVVVWGYPTTFETLRGRTPGKAALGLRVVTTEGAPIRFRHAAIRAAFGLLDFYLFFGGVAVLSVLITKRQQRLGDLVAGTLVLRERTAAHDVAPVTFAVPSGAESYAQTVDASGLDADDYAAIRSFLLRSGTLDPAARERLGVTLAQRLAARLAHVPPAGVSPELFLVVAAARYQQRFATRGPAPVPGAGSNGAAPPAVAPPVARPAPDAAEQGARRTSSPAPGAADAPEPEPAAAPAPPTGGFQPPG